MFFGLASSHLRSPFAINLFRLAQNFHSKSYSVVFWLRSSLLLPFIWCENGRFHSFYHFTSFTSILFVYFKNIFPIQNRFGSMPVAAEHLQHGSFLHIALKRCKKMKRKKKKNNVFTLFVRWDPWEGKKKRTKLFCFLRSIVHRRFAYRCQRFYCFFLFVVVEQKYLHFFAKQNIEEIEWVCICAKMEKSKEDENEKYRPYNKYLRATLTLLDSDVDVYIFTLIIIVMWDENVRCAQWSFCHCCFGYQTVLEILRRMIKGHISWNVSNFQF